MENKNSNIQEIIKDLTNKIDIINNQFKIVFNSVSKFKHKRHLIIYSYLMGYYTSKGNTDFNQDVLFNSLEIFEKSLSRKTELINLIIALALSMNRCNEFENKNNNNNKVNENDNNKKNENNNNKEKEKNPPIMDITETMLSSDPFLVYQQFFGETVFERPLNYITNNNKNNINLNLNNKKEETNKQQNNQTNIENNQNINNIIKENNQEKENNIKLNNNKSNINEINKNLQNNKNNDIDNDNYTRNKNIFRNDIINNNITNNNNINNIDNKNIVNNNIANNNFNQKTHKNKKNNIIDKQIKQKTINENMIGKYNTEDTDNIHNIVNKKNTITVIGDSKKIIKCFICSENFNELDKNNYRLNCKCIIHSKCFKNYLINSIKTNKIPILCPKCRNEINKELVYKFLNSIKDKKLIKLYENYSLDFYIRNYEKTNDIIYYCCPTRGCNKYVPCKRDEKKLICPHCKNSYCIKCYRPWHENQTCEEYFIQYSMINNNRAKNNNINDNSELKKPLYQTDINNYKYKECQKCQTLMLKDEKTNKILCFCGTTFCYKCGKIIKEKHECSSQEK